MIYFYRSTFAFPAKCTNTALLVDNLRTDTSVKYVDVNSTLGRSYVEHHNDAQPSIYKPSDVTLVGEESEGRALVICNTIRRKTWLSEYRYAQTVLEKHLRLQVGYNHVL